MLRALLSIIVLALLLPQAAPAGEFTDKQRQEIGTIVREYLLQNPDVLLEVGQELERRQQAGEEEKRKTALTANAKEIFHSPADLVAGNPQGSITMVEFFDYNCAWCKRSVSEVLRLLDTDKDLRLVLKEFPIFGENSEYAARAALASQGQGKYWPFHLALLQHEGNVSKETVDEIAAAQGLDMVKLKSDMDAPAIAETIARNQALAGTLAINGTPSFVVDTKVIPGYLPHDGLLAAVEEIRAAGGCSLC